MKAVENLLVWNKKLSHWLFISVLVFIYLLKLGFHSVAVAGRLVQKEESDSTKWETMHKTQNTQNRKQKYKTKTNIKIIFKKTYVE